MPALGELNGAAARRILNVVDAVRELYTDADAMNALHRLAASDPYNSNSNSSSLNMNSLNRGSSAAATAAGRRRPKRNPNPCGYCSFYKQKVRLSIDNKEPCSLCKQMLMLMDLTI